MEERINMISRIAIIIFIITLPLSGWAMKPIKDSDLSKANCPSGINVSLEEETDKQPRNGKFTNLSPKSKKKLLSGKDEPEDKTYSGTNSMVKDPNKIMNSDEQNTNDKTTDINELGKSQPASAKSIDFSKGASEHSDYTIHHGTKARDRYMINPSYDIQPKSWVDIIPR